MMNTKKLWIFICTYIIIITIPYLLACKIVDNTHNFGGFLINPIDGNSYLAKMYLGYQGDWQFNLLYSPAQGEGAYLFLFYILLGHIARWLGLPLVVIFHLSRILSSLAFLFSLSQFLKKIFIRSTEPIWEAFLLCTMGSGLGWVMSLGGGNLSADFWVAEAYPFLSSLTSPHFTLGIAVFLWILSTAEGNSSSLKSGFQIWISGIILAIVMPFGVVLAGIICSVYTVWNWIEKKEWAIVSPAALLLGAGPVVLWQYWQTLRDPLLSQWNAQNITPAPALWDILLSFSPALMFAFVGIAYLFREKEISRYKMLLIWLIVGFGLLYFPFSLQRRFIFGLYVPVSILAAWGVHCLTRQKQHLRAKWMALLIGISVITNVLLILSGVLAVNINHPRLVLTKDERDALTWIEANTPEDTVVLCSAEMGNFVPALTGRRVLYGHPFESVQAQQMNELVTGFFAGEHDTDFEKELWEKYRIGIILYSPRERVLGIPDVLEPLTVMYQNQTVSVFQASSGN